jgi:gas vesicle protein
MALGRSGRALERLLGGLERSVGGLGEVSGVMLAPKMAAKSRKILKKSGSKRQAVPQRFFMDFVSKISSWGDPKVCI